MIPDLLCALHFYPKELCKSFLPPSVDRLHVGTGSRGREEEARFSLSKGKRRLDFNRKGLMFILPGPVFCSLVATPF